jgi:hypothetical protein
MEIEIEDIATVTIESKSLPKTKSSRSKKMTTLKKKQKAK